MKGAAIPYLQPYAHRVASLDSQAWGAAARRDGRRRQVSKTDAFAADHMEHWTIAQLDRLREPQRPLAIAIEPAPSQIPSDAWETAIQQAQAEMRALIESGDLAHDEVTAGWIEAWAADLYHRRPKAA